MSIVLSNGESINIFQMVISFKKNKIGLIICKRFQALAQDDSAASRHGAVGVFYYYLESNFFSFVRPK